MSMLMRQQLRLQHGKVALSRAAACPRRRLACSARAGGGNPLEPFNENAAQVKRLVQRDRKDFLGNEVDILDKYEKEFGSFEDPAADSSTPSTSSSSNGSSSAAPVASTSVAAPAASPPAAAAAKPASPFASSVASSFTASKPAVSSPFGPSTTPYKKSVVEPKGLSPDMSPDPIRAPAAAPGNFLSRITLTQVVLFLSFSTIIGLMIATFSVVVSTGAVRLSGI